MIEYLPYTVYNVYKSWSVVLRTREHKQNNIVKSAQLERNIPVYLEKLLVRRNTPRSDTLLK